MAGNDTSTVVDIRMIPHKNLRQSCRLELTRGLRDRLDSERGSVDRSAYVRMLLDAELRPGRPTGEVLPSERDDLVDVSLSLDYEIVERAECERGDHDLAAWVEALLWRALARERPHLWPGWTLEQASEELCARLERHAERYGLGPKTD